MAICRRPALGRTRTEPPGHWGLDAGAAVAGVLRSSDEAALMEPRAAAPKHLPLLRVGPPEHGLLVAEDDYGYYLTGDEAWEVTRSDKLAEQPSSDTDVPSTAASEHGLVWADAEDEFQCSATGDEAPGVTSRSSSKSEVSQTSRQSDRASRRRRKRRAGPEDPDMGGVCHPGIEDGHCLPLGAEPPQPGAARGAASEHEIVELEAQDEFKYYETGDEDCELSLPSPGSVFCPKSPQSTASWSHWPVEATVEGEFKYYATSHEDYEVSSRWSSKSYAASHEDYEVGSRWSSKSSARPAPWSDLSSRQRRRRRPGAVKIAECLIALDHVEDTRRILRVSRTRLLGIGAQKSLKSYLEAHHGSVSMMLAGNTERKHAAGMFFVVMERVEDALALMAGAEERELVVGGADVLVRTFKRTSDA